MMTWMMKNLFFPFWDAQEKKISLPALAELEKTQWMKKEQLEAHQWEKLQALLHYAYENCQFYRESFGRQRIKISDVKTPKDFLAVPVLSKKDIRENGDALVAKQFRKHDLVMAKTGGSTGVALTVYCDETCRALRNAAAMRSDKWAGWDIGMKKAAIWGNPPVASTLREKVRNFLHDRIIYLDTMDVNEESLTEFVVQCRKFKPKVFFGHSHSIYILAKYLKEQDIHDIRPKGIISTSMMLLEPERRLIEEVFHCPVTNRYGCEEVSLIGCECERQEGFHLNIDHVVVEFLREDGTEAAPGEEASIVVTELINRGMPLIRYRVEDMGVRSDRSCSCGRGLPLMERVTGRRADFLKRLDGSLVAGVSLVERTLTAIPGIGQMQLVQNDLHHVCAKVVKDGNFNEEYESRLRSELQTVFGNEVTIEMQYVSALDQTRSGKYRFAICNV